MISQQQTASDGGARPARRRRPAQFVVALLALAAVAFVGRALGARWARHVAARHIDGGEIAAAERALAWAARLDADDYRTELLQAACARQLGQQEAWADALAQARRSNAGREASIVEAQLGALRWGQVADVDRDDVEDLIEAGASPREAASAIVYGLLAKGDRTAAEELIRTWAADTADVACAAYLRGVTSLWSRDLETAKREFEQTLDRQPRHEPARAALARVLEERHDLGAALAHYGQLARVAPHREAARLDLARVLRKLGRLADARAVLSIHGSGTETTTAAAIERAQIEYESGNYTEAGRWFKRVNLDGAQIAETLRAAASTAAFQGDAAYAGQLFARVDQAQDLARQLSEWQRRRMMDPGDLIAAGELARLSAETPPARPSAAGEDSSAPPVLRLYGQHCAACHGPDGNGDGRAARHLFPRPLNLRADRMRLVGTLNGVPTVEDIEQVIRQGVPGTAMPAFAELSADERRQLALQVQRFRREGIREQLLARISIQGDTIDDAELHRLVTGLSTPGAVLHVPAIGSASAESIARGRNHYANVGCRQCHGDDGTGATELLVFDEVGQPAFPRDLVHDPMKGGTSGESLYSRIRLGMPGTPHPAVTSLSESELIDLVQFCRSLSQSPHPHLTNYQRALQAARRASAAHLTPMAAPPATE